MSKFKSALRIARFTLAGSVVLGLIGLFVWYVAWLKWVENYELGYIFDARNGTITVVDHTGYISSPPFVTHVNTIDLRPMQLCISANRRTLNCKLVKFDPEGLDLFLTWHGRDDYDIESEGIGGLRDILKSYAFDESGTVYPFLTIMSESGNTTPPQ